MNVQYKHLRKIKNNKIHNMGGETWVFEVGDYGEVLRYAVAVCSDKDNFCKKVGRDIAYDRLLNEPKHPCGTITAHDMINSLEEVWEEKYAGI